MTKRKKHGLGEIRGYLSWSIDVLAAVDYIIKPYHQTILYKTDLEHDLNELFGLMLLLDEAPINKKWLARHPLTDLLISIKDWAEDSRVPYAIIKSVTTMVKTHPCNISRHQRSIAKKHGFKDWDSL